MTRVLRARKFGLSIVALTALAVMPSVAMASFTNRVLQNPGLPGLYLPGTWQSQQNFLATNGTNTLDVTVDYAVFAPGVFPGSYTPFAGFPAPAPNEFVYAYQVYNTGVANGGSSNTAFSQLGINAGGGLINSLGKDQSVGGPLSDPTGVNTNFAFLSPQGASYLFLVPSIGVNQFSIVLLLASPDGPTLAQASVFDSGLSANGQLPMPVPEPGTLALVVLGFGLLRRQRSRA